MMSTLKLFRAVVAIHAVATLALIAPETAVAAPDGFKSSAAAAITPKPLAPIAISHRIDAEPRVGQPLEIVVIVTAKAHLQNGVAKLSTGDGLQLVAPLADVWLPNLTDDASFEIPITVLPLIDGRFFVSVSVGGDVGGRFQVRSVGVPVRVGPERPVAPSANVKTDSNGQRLHSLPAQESVR